jgi:hypothetical protein
MVATNVGTLRLLVANTSRCGKGIRGLKYLLVIGQKAEIGPNPFPPRGQADLVVWMF